MDASPADRIDDAVWAALQWGDAAAAEALAETQPDPALARRARWDALALRAGRAAALDAARRAGDPLALRYLASAERARDALAAVASPRGPALWLEELRLSRLPERRVSLLARLPGAGSVEGLALAVEAHQARGRWERAGELLEHAPDSRRLALARRRQWVGTGRPLRAAHALLDDLEAGRVVPASLELLTELLTAWPDRAREARACAALAARPPDPAWAPWARRAHDRLAALLAQRAGAHDAERALRTALAPTSLADHRRAERLVAREAVDAALHHDEQRVDRAGARRPEHPALRRLRLADEWALAARLQYAGLSTRGSAGDWPGFAAALDAAGAHLPGAARLAPLPTRDYGWFGQALDVPAAVERFPGWMLVGGKALGLPPMLAVYDLLEAREASLPGGGHYLQCHVANLRVPSWLGWRGARFAGAGLERFVFLDHDALREAPDPARAPLAPAPLEAWPAAGREQRRALDEPLDVAARVAAAARADAGARWFELRLQSLAEHEERHIVDTRAFLEAGWFGRLGALLGAGLLPSGVRAELERRAQLAALQRADDPRIPLAEALAVLPVEGSRTASEHARGYAALLADLVALIDARLARPGDPLRALGLRGDRVLVQQLHLLPPEVVRELARALD